MMLQTDCFPVLGRVIKAAMSIFAGPMIGLSFSGINDLLTPKTNRLSIETVSDIQSVKFELRLVANSFYQVQ